jgi:hypothetical protein
MTSSSMADSSSPEPPTRGLRVFTCGHSFHYWVADMLSDMATAAGIVDHQVAGTSVIGGSQVIQHWDVPDAENEAKKALAASSVDVLTLSCMTQPDEGIGRFARLAVQHNPHIRITLQELWLPEDRFPFDPKNRVRTSVDQFDGPTMAELEVPHQTYFRVMEDHVGVLNAEIGREAISIVPDAQATLALRERIIAGTAPGLDRQSELFTDAWGHPSPPLRVLSACCHFAVIYGRSPVGLPLPELLASDPRWGTDLNGLLQQLAWDAVTQHPLSGVGAVS